MLKIQGLKKKFGNFEALSGLDMEVAEGALYGFVGPNGAGKTTAIRIITGLLNADEGSVLIDGKDAFCYRDQVKDLFGYVPDEFGLYDNLKVWEYMDFFASCYGLSGLVARERCTNLLEQVKLADKEDFFVDSLSRGMKQRLCLARAMIHDPKLLILDEPTNGLDPMGIVEVRKILTHLNKDQGKTILVSSHNLEEMHKLATDYLFISHGRLIRRMTAPQLEKSCRGGFVLHVDDLERTRSVLGDETSHSFLPDGSVLMRYEEKKEGRGIAIEALSTAGVRVAEAYSHRKSLEEFYSELIGRESEL